MKRRTFIKGIGVGVFATLPLFFLGCESRIDLGPKEVNWERDECERCAMMMGDRTFATQVVNKEDGKAYFFDDIGCAILWLNQAGNILKLDNTNIYVKNPQNDEFIDAKEALYTTDIPSPMSFNFLANDQRVFKPENTNYLSFQQVVVEMNKYR